MIFGIKTVANYLLGRDRVERDFRVFPDDTMLVSYPRSGNTWTRFLIANLLHPELEVSFANIETLIPDTAAISSRALKRIPRPRVIKSHEYFDHRYPKVVYIVRDPRDVTLSLYNFQRKKRQIPDNWPFEKYVDDFVNGRLNSASWGTWAENVGSWISTRGKSSTFLLLRYENMLRDPIHELERVADFMKLVAGRDTLERAVANCSSERMRQMEKQQENQWKATKEHRKDIPFVGAAQAGVWETSMPMRSILQIEAAWGDLMTSLGYSLTPRSATEIGLSVVARR